ncbi:MAG TPA: restriction endonuclease subunit S [Stenotrophobium sp.]|nr:restriction endonuclease subunit S [Stenotrophobium sp.]
MKEDNLLSLSYGRIVRKDIASNDGLLPDSYETYQVVQPNDVVFRLTDLQNDKRSLRTAIVNETGIITSAYLAVTPKEIDSRYFAYLLRFYDLTKVFYSMGGGLRQSMKYADVKRLPVIMPSRSEQSAIAIFLDRETGKIDALIAEQEKLLTLLAEKRQATISHAVTRGLDPDAPMKDSGVPWLGEVPAHWEVRRLKTLSVFTTSGPRGWSDRITEEGSLFIQSGDLDDNLEVDFLNAKRVSVDDDAEAVRTRLADGDIVICITGAKTGNVAVCGVIPEPAFVNQHLCLVRPSEEVHSRYLGLALKSRFGQVQLDLSQYGLKQGLSLENIRELLIVLPPHDEQLAIAAHLDAEAAKFDRLTDDATQAIALLKERRSALIAAAVTGKIDVRNEALETTA